MQNRKVTEVDTTVNQPFKMVSISIYKSFQRENIAFTISFFSVIQSTNIKSFKSQFYLSTFYIMVRKRKRNQFSSKKCKTYTFDKIMADIVKSIEDVKDLSHLMFLNQFSNGWRMPLNVKKKKKKNSDNLAKFSTSDNVFSALWINVKITLIRSSK